MDLGVPRARDILSQLLVGEVKRSPAGRGRPRVLAELVVRALPDREPVDEKSAAIARAINDAKNENWCLEAFMEGDHLKFVYARGPNAGGVHEGIVLEKKCKKFRPQVLVMMPPGGTSERDAVSYQLSQMSRVEFVKAAKVPPQPSISKIAKPTALDV